MKSLSAPPKAPALSLRGGVGAAPASAPNGAGAPLCHGCGGELPPRHGKQRKWCSERCRRAQYSRPCVDCGTPVNGSNGSGPNAPQRCVPCANRHSAVERWRLRRELVEYLWSEGKTSRQIAAVFGITGPSASQYIGQCRHRGYDVPHRHSGVALANVQAAARVNNVKARAVAAERRAAR